MVDLDALLKRLTKNTDAALQQWALKEEIELGDEGAWLSLEHNPYTRATSGRWECGYRVRLDETEEWVLLARGATPTEAALALLKEIER